MHKPTQPKAPKKPYKPAKPLKVLTYYEQIYLDLYSSSDKITFAELLEKVPEGVDHKDVYLSMTGADYGCCDCCSGYVRGYYPRNVENKQYKTQMKAYEKKMTGYTKKLEEFNVKLGEWKIKKDEYIESLQEWENQNTAREINKLEKQLKRLKAS